MVNENKGTGKGNNSTGKHINERGGVGSNPPAKSVSPGVPGKNNPKNKD